MPGSYLVWDFELGEQSKERGKASQVSDEFRHELQAHLDEGIAAADDVALHLKRSDGNIDEFGELAPHIIEAHDGIGHFTLAPNGIVEASYPEGAHENIIGMNVMTVHRRAALKARRSRKMVDDGPLNQEHGDFAVIGILPIFLPGDQESDRFWGFISVTLSVHTLKEHAKLDSLPQEGYEYRLRAGNADKPTVLAQSAGKLPEDPVDETIDTPSSKWVLSIAPTGGWKKNSTYPFSIPVMLIFLGFISSTVNLFATRAGRLEEEVNRRTSELTRSKELSEAVNTIDLAINSATDPDDMMNQAVAIALEAARCDTVAVALIDEEYLMAKYIAGQLHGSAPVRLNLEGEWVKAMVEVAGKPKVIDDYLNDPRVNKEIGRRFSLRSLLAAPLVVRGRVLGILIFIYHHEPVGFTPFEIDFAEKISASMSLAVENAELLHIERGIASTLQEALISLPSRVHGIDFDNIYRSANLQNEKAGGDFYDLFEIKGGNVGIVIGDISGKGLHAATLTSVVRNSIRAYVAENYSVSKVIAKTNEICCSAFEQATFATVIFGILEIGSGRLTFCNAGHPRALVVAEEGVTIMETARTNVPLGVMENTTFHEHVWQVGKEDTLFFYTDGLVEAKKESGRLNEARLIAILSELNFSDTRDLPALVVEDIFEKNGYRQRDDVAIISMSLEGVGIPESEFDEPQEIIGVE